MNDKIKRKIRSFVMRVGKLTAGQQRALTELLPIFKLDETQAFNPNTAFEKKQPVWVDIGFGNGESLIHIAQLYPEINFVGMEVHLAGIGHLLLNIEKLNIKNIRIYQHDSTEVLKDCFTANSIDAIHIYFPDPWHKKRHHKRRLIQDQFVKSLIPLMNNKSHLHIATDWQEYAEHIQETMQNIPAFENIEVENGFSQRPEWRPITKFERRGINLGHNSYDLIYKLNKTTE
jgi:tRNA (guanine-N7-)-methyltransferase